MDRRTFIAVTGIGAGLAGCLDGDGQVGSESDSADDGDGVADEPESSDDGDADGGFETDGEEADDEESEPSGDGETTEETAEADGEDGNDAEADNESESDADDESGADGDGADDGGESEPVEDEENGGEEDGEDEEPVEDGEDGEDEENGGEEDGEDEEPVEDGEDGEDEENEAGEDGEEGDEPDVTDGDRTVSFDSCTRATVTGTFEDGDVAFASTGFYTASGYGNTMIEDGVRFGDDVDAPFTGTVVVEVDGDGGVTASDDQIRIAVPDYGDGTTVITSLTTDPDDYRTASVTHPNPQADTCIEAVAEDAEANGESNAT